MNMEHMLNDTDSENWRSGRKKNMSEYQLIHQKSCYKQLY